MNSELVIGQVLAATGFNATWISSTVLEFELILSSSFSTEITFAVCASVVQETGEKREFCCSAAEYSEAPKPIAGKTESGEQLSLPDAFGEGDLSG